MTSTNANPYAMPHKVARYAIYEAAQRLGRLDLGSESEVEEATSSCLSALKFLRLHARIEDEVYHPTLAARAPGIVHRLASEHEMVDPMYASLEASVRALQKAPLQGRMQALNRLIDEWNEFTAIYSAHLRREERDGLEVWQEHFEAHEVAAVLASASQLVEPSMREVVLPIMLASLSPVEIARLYAEAQQQGDDTGGRFEVLAREVCGDARWARVQEAFRGLQPSRRRRENDRGN